MIPALVLLAGAAFPAIEVQRTGKEFEVVVDAFVELPREDVWALLTDYDNLAGLSESIQDSHGVVTDDGTRLVDTVSRSCKFLVCRTVHHRQSVHESPPDRIVAITVPGHSDFRSGVAEWELQQVQGGTRILYRMTVTPSFFVPPLVGTAIMRAALRDEARALVRGLQSHADAR